MRHASVILQALRRPEALAFFSLADWDMLVRQAREANLLAHIYDALNSNGLIDAIPAQAREHFVWSSIVAERHREAVQWEVMLIRKALEEVGVSVILLKGAAYVIAKLPPAQGRIFSDVDIIVPKEKLDAVEANLMLHGWVATHHDAYDQRYYRTWMHELPPMRHLKRLTVIDVHHAILPETAYVNPNPQKLCAAAIPIPEQSNLLVFAPDDMVLHSAAHLFHNEQFDHGLRDLVDIDGLLRHFSKRSGFWSSLISRAEELGLTRTLFYAMRYAKIILHTPVPDEILNASQIDRPSRIMLMLMDRLFLRALMPMHSSCSDWFTGIARQLLYVRANWLRMPPLLLARHLFHKAFISPKSK